MKYRLSHFKKTVTQRNKKSLRERSRTISEYRNALEVRIINRVEMDLNKGCIDKAINRYEGFFQYYSMNQRLHNEVAKLYIQKGDKIRAGRHLFFKENLTKIELECVNKFKQSCGNSSTIILKKRIAKENFRVKELSDYAKHKLKVLIKEASEESGKTPNFLKGFERYFEKKEY